MKPIPHKQFLYCESTEKGMEQRIIESPGELSALRDWMMPKTRNEDICLSKWMTYCCVGSMYAHRLGVMVRLVDDCG